MTDRRDPVERAFESRDLYDVATWENRTTLDGVAVWIDGALRTGSRALVVLAAAVILLAQFAIVGFAVFRNPTLAFLALFSVVPALALAAYVWYADPTLRQPVRTLVVTFVLGVLFAGFAAVVNTLLNPLFTLVPVVGMALYFFVVVGPVEEFVKWLAVRLHAYRSETFHAVVDGAVYGAVAGLGFATIENLIYITRVYLMAAQAGGGTLAATVGITGVRSLAGPGHVIYSAFAGYYLGLAKFNPGNQGPIVVKGLLIAAVVHATYNTVVSYAPLSLLTFLAFVVAFDGVLLAVLFRKLSRYRAAYREAESVEDDVAPGGTCAFYGRPSPRGGMGLIDSLVVFVVGLVVGAVGIHAGARIVAGVRDYERAVVTALVGSVVHAVVGFFLGWIPLLGPVLTLAAYVGVVNWRYPGGWLDATAIALVAWLASLVVLGLLSAVGIGDLNAVGVPGA